jgi:hypothetical protein
MRASKLVVPVVLALAAALASPAWAAPAKVDVVARGLDAPRHLAFGARGDLFVAEAGRGGSGPCFVAGEGPACMGASGAVTEIDRRGHQFRIAQGLASFANTVPDPNPMGVTPNPIGPHGITVLGADQVFVTNGGPTEPKDANGADISRNTLAAQNPAANLFGRLLWIKHRGRPRSIADIWAFERDVNPDAGIGNPAVDSNAVDVLFDRGRFVIADAGGNAIDRASFFGRVSNLTVFANRTVPNPFPPPPPAPQTVDMQAVPTSVVEGPDHQYYVSQLTGFPFPPGGANVYRVDPRSGDATVFAGGFTNIMDLAFGRDGTLYVLEISHSGLLSGADGAIFAVSRHGTRRQIELAPGTLTAPGGITVGRDGLYVSNQTFVPGEGQVLRIQPR